MCHGNLSQTEMHLLDWLHVVFKVIQINSDCYFVSFIYFSLRMSKRFVLKWSINIKSFCEAFHDKIFILHTSTSVWINHHHIKKKLFIRQIDVILQCAFQVNTHFYERIQLELAIYIYVEMQFRSWHTSVSEYNIPNDYKTDAGTPQNPRPP